MRALLYQYRMWRASRLWQRMRNVERRIKSGDANIKQARRIAFGLGDRARAYEDKARNMRGFGLA